MRSPGEKTSSCAEESGEWIERDEGEVVEVTAWGELIELAIVIIEVVEYFR